MTVVHHVRGHRWSRPSTVADHPWRSEGAAIVRAACGGLLFGAPLLYTMEVWWAGSHASPIQLLVVLALLVLPVFVLNLTGGFRSHRDLGAGDALVDTVECLAVGLVGTAVVLFVLREIGPGTPSLTALGKIVYESVPFCLGVGVARHFLSGARDEEPDGSSDATKDERTEETTDDEGTSNDADAVRGGTASDLLATTIGATFVALSIAPTDEVPMLASRMSPGWLVLLIAVSVVTTYAIVFAAGFGDQASRRQQAGILQHPSTETISSYLVAVAVAATLLVVFQRGGGPPADLFHRAVVLGFPAAVGGAAGRLAI